MTKFVSGKIRRKSGARLAAVQATYMIAYGQLPVDEVIKDFTEGKVGRYVIEEDAVTETEEMIEISPIDTDITKVWYAAFMPKNKIWNVRLNII